MNEDPSTDWTTLGLSKNSNQTYIQNNRASFLDNIFAHALIQPNSPAIEYEGKKVSYNELKNHTELKKHKLIETGFTSGDRVALLNGRSPEQLEWMLAILDLSGSFIPLTDALPQARIDSILEDAKPSIIVQNGQIRRLNQDPLKSSKPEAYLIYTSGSTGKPKGVSISVQNIESFLKDAQEILNISNADRWLAMSAFSFDISILEILLPLIHGGTVVVAPADTIFDPEFLAHQISNHRITIAQATPSLWSMISKFKVYAPDCTLITAGEPLNTTLAKRLLQQFKRILNAYGPTETTIWSTAGWVTDPEKITIGRPIPSAKNTTIIQGELWIKGNIVGNGYWNRPELNSEKFIYHNGQATFKTGDLASWTPEGEILFHGRRDHQVKVRGYRIELGEIDAQIEKINGVSRAKTIANHAGTDDAALIAYVEGTITEKTDWEDIVKQELSRFLPNYMIPNQLKSISNFDLSPSAKIDQSKLITTFDSNKSELVKPTPLSKTEQKIAMIWSEFLGAQEWTRESHFMKMGGQSLMGVEAAIRLSEAFQMKINLWDILNNKLGELAASIESNIRKPLTSENHTSWFGGLSNRLRGKK